MEKSSSLIIIGRPGAERNPALLDLKKSLNCKRSYQTLKGDSLRISKPGNGSTVPLVWIGNITPSINTLNETLAPKGRLVESLPSIKTLTLRRYLKKRSEELTPIKETKFPSDKFKTVNIYISRRRADSGGGPFLEGSLPSRVLSRLFPTNISSKISTFLVPSHQ